MSDDLPIVGRPRGGAWRQLQSEGILWEGQILVAGGDTDLAALLIITNDRLALVRGGAVALDIRHHWLAAPPSLHRTGSVDLQVLTPGQRRPESLTFIIREGRLAAAELVDILSPRERYEPEFPTWNSNSFLDEDDIIPARPAPYERKHSPDPVDPLPAFPIYAALDDDDFPPIAPPPDPAPDWSGAPRLTAGTTIDPDANAIPRQNDWNLKPLNGMDNKDRRDRRAWVMRVAAIFLAVAGIGAWQGGLLPDYESIRDRLPIEAPTVYTVAELPGTPTTIAQVQPTKTTPVKSTATIAPSTQESSPSQNEPVYSPAEQTALALGVGGEGDETENEVADTPVPTTEPTEAVTSTEPIIEPPAMTATSEPTTEPMQESVTEEANEPAEEPSVIPTKSAPSVMPTERPRATIANGTLDYQITDLHIGASLPDLTLGPLQGEQWVVVNLTIANRGSEVAPLDPAAFELVTASGDIYELDSATGAVAAYLGVSGSTNSREIAPGERTSLVLVFVPSADATGLILQNGDTSLPLEIGASGQTITDMPLTANNQTADGLSAQLLLNTFEQFTIGAPTATTNARTVPDLGKP